MPRSRVRWWSVFLSALLIFLPGAELSLQAQKKKTSRRRARYTVPSYGNPTGKDTEVGEDRAVREVAARALGKLNGSVIVVEADTGRVLTIVNQPLALSAGFKPRSTIKPAAAPGGREEGFTTGDTLLALSHRESINLTEALAYSNNPFFEILGKKMGFEKVSAYSRLLGFGELAGYLVEDEYPSSFPTTPPANGGGGRVAG